MTVSPTARCGCGAVARHPGSRPPGRAAEVGRAAGDGAVAGGAVDGGLARAGDGQGLGQGRAGRLRRGGAYLIATRVDQCDAIENGYSTRAERAPSLSPAVTLACKLLTSGHWSWLARAPVLALPLALLRC